MGTFLDPDCDLPMFAAARAPAQQHSRTSMQAADSLDAKALNALQRKVLAWLAENGPATDEEMQVGLNMNPSTQRPRRIELAKRGLVVEAGVRMTKARRAAVVWGATAASR
jgi:DNA-binding Lrp family transcriptional regulator